MNQSIKNLLKIKMNPSVKFVLKNLLFAAGTYILIFLFLLLYFYIPSHAETNVTVGGCGTGVCEAYYPVGTTVTQTAKVDDPTKAYFTGWIGNICHGTNPVCTFTMPAYHVYLTAIFDVKAVNGMYVNAYGRAGGNIKSSPEGIDCTSTGYDTMPIGNCQAKFPVGQKVYFTITHPTSGTFQQWGVTKYSGKYYTTMSIARTLNVEFK